MPVLGPLPDLLPVIDAALPGDGLPCIAAVDADPSGEPRVTATLLPAGTVHPADFLLGRRLHARHQLLCLRVPGLVHQLAPVDAYGTAGHDHPEPGTTQAQILAVVDRSGAIITRIADPDGRSTLLTESPVGWVADMLLRAVGAPTPAPGGGLAACVEAFWIDDLARHLLVRPRPAPDWDHLARRHPLAPPGAALPGVLLAIETQTLAAESDWSHLRRRFHWSDAAIGGWAPPWTVPVPLGSWFDDGSFARWLLGGLIPAADLLPAVLDVLPDRVGSELLDALTTVDIPVLGW